MKVLFIALNPSSSSPTCEPMHPSTRSRRVLDSWIAGLDIDPIFINLIDKPTENNRPLKKSEIKENEKAILSKIESIDADAIVSLGKNVHDFLTDHNIKHESLPHPSGRNRVLNDISKIEEVKSRLSILVQNKR